MTSVATTSLTGPSLEELLFSVVTVGKAGRREKEMRKIQFGIFC